MNSELYNKLNNISNNEFNDILQNNIDSIRKDSELTFCKNYTLSTKRLDSIIN